MHTIEDISFEKINRFISMANQKRAFPITDDPLTVLTKLQAIRDNKITFGAYLLFTKDNPIISTIEMGRFIDDISIKDDVTIREDLFSEVELIINFISKHIKKQFREVSVL